MFDIHSLDDLAALRESHELECKLAEGQHGQGEEPKDFWPTYSAMANAHGGVVLLGVREKTGVFSVAGLSNPAKVRADLFNNLNNPGKVSVNLLTDADGQEVLLSGQTVLKVTIPPATRQQKPVAMTAGLAFEGMNHAGVADTDMLIILNDNCMGIDPNVGALKEYLTDITTSPTYNKVKDDVWKLLGKLPVGKNFTRSMAHKMAEGLKGMVSSSANLFEALKLRYFGPIDGHNIAKLVDTLKDLREIPGPKILHIITTKGKGYSLAEQDQTKWHAPGLFDKVNR